MIGRLTVDTADSLREAPACVVCAVHPEPASNPGEPAPDPLAPGRYMVSASTPHISGPDACHVPTSSRFVIRSARDGSCVLDDAPVRRARADDRRASWG